MVSNRKFEGKDRSIQERKHSRIRSSQPRSQAPRPAETLVVKALRLSLSILVFDAIKEVLPSLWAKLEIAVSETSTQLAYLGAQRYIIRDCRGHLLNLSVSCLEP